MHRTVGKNAERYVGNLGGYDGFERKGVAGIRSSSFINPNRAEEKNLLFRIVDLIMPCFILSLVQKIISFVENQIFLLTCSEGEARGRREIWIKPDDHKVRVVEHSPTGPIISWVPPREIGGRKRI